MTFDYKIIIDTREKENKHIVEKLKKNNIDIDNVALKIGDYAITTDYGHRAGVVIERKASLNELISNLLDKVKDLNGNNRFNRELIRAKENNIKIIVLIEEIDWYSKLLNGDYISQVNPKAIRGLIMSLEAKFPNLSIVGVDKRTSASYIHTTLYYHLRQELKEVDYG